MDVTEAAGLSFVHANGARGEKLLPETMGSGAAFLDFDNDGDQDLFLVNSGPWPGQGQDQGPNPGPTQALYRNDGAGRFVDVTRQAGLDQTLFGMGVAVGDVDNDGDDDLYVTTLQGGRLFRNSGGEFLDVTNPWNARGGDGWLTSAAFLDLENDGDLDLFLCQYVDWSPEADRALTTPVAGETVAYDPPTAFHGSFCILLRNDGGRFTDVSEAAGVQVRTPGRKQAVAKALGVAPFDVNGDGLVDLAVANDTVQNFLFMNQGGGKFEEVGILAGIAFDSDGSARGAMGIDWGHVRNDPSVALAIGNFAHEMTALFVADDPTTPGVQFTDQATFFGLGAPTRPPLKFGLFFFDYDLDGRLDLLTVNGHLEPNIDRGQTGETYRQAAQLFWNSGQGRPLFVPVGSDDVGPDLFRPIVGRGSTYADIDGDGDLDLLLTDNGGPARLLRNDGGNVNHWLRLLLKGSKSNRDALGARVNVLAGGVEPRRQLHTAKGYLSAVERPLTFGLGKTNQVDRLTVVWPSGKTTTLVDLKADQQITLEETNKNK